MTVLAFVTIVAIEVRAILLNVDAKLIKAIELLSAAVNVVVAL